MTVQTASAVVSTAQKDSAKAFEPTTRVEANCEIPAFRYYIALVNVALTCHASAEVCEIESVLSCMSDVRPVEVDVLQASRKSTTQQTIRFDSKHFSTVFKEGSTKPPA